MPRLACLVFKRIAGLVVRCLALACLLFGPVQAQSTQTPSDQDEVISVKTRLVNIDVTVKDKRGKPIFDLKPEDFSVYENGVKQTLEFFDPPLVARAGAPATTASRGAPRNIVTLMLDAQTTEHTNLKLVREGTLKYIQDRITDRDIVAVFTISNGLQLLQTFTNDKTKLAAAVEKAFAASPSAKTAEQRSNNEEIARLREASAAGDGAGGAAQAGGAGAAAAGSAGADALIAARVLQQFIMLRSVLSLQQSRPVLAALAALCEALRALPGKKTLVLFSQGFVTPETLDWQIQHTVDIANRANVAIYIIDSAGLIAKAPQGGSHFQAASPLGGISALNEQSARIRASGGENVFDTARHEGVNREYDVLYRISGDTGGKFFKGNNDIGLGLERMDNEIRARYTLAYHSTNQNFDGSFRKLKVEVGRADTQVVTRAGYYAISYDAVPLSPDDRKLLAGFASAQSAASLPLFLQVSTFRGRGGRYIIPVFFEVPPGAVKFDAKGDKQRMQLDVLGVVRESDEKMLSRIGGNFDVGLSAEQYQLILNNNIFYRQDLELAPGTYVLDLIVKDRLSGKTTARRERMVLPDLTSDFSISDVVLSRTAQAAPTTASAEGPYDVFSYGGARIRPTPSREFRPADNLIIFFELYGVATNPTSAKPQVKVTVTLMRENQPALKPVQFVMTDSISEPVPHLTFANFIGLTKLTPGKYTAVIEARDTVSGKVVGQQTPFTIVK